MIALKIKSLIHESPWWVILIGLTHCSHALVLLFLSVLSQTLEFSRRYLNDFYTRATLYDDHNLQVHLKCFDPNI
mgnify:CR=1 FL=1